MIDAVNVIGGDGLWFEELCRRDRCGSWLLGSLGCAIPERSLTMTTMTVSVSLVVKQIDEDRSFRSYSAFMWTGLKSSLPWKYTAMMHSPPSSHLS